MYEYDESFLTSSLMLYILFQGAHEKELALNGLRCINKGLNE